MDEFKKVAGDWLTNALWRMQEDGSGGKRNPKDESSSIPTSLNRPKASKKISSTMKFHFGAFPLNCDLFLVAILILSDDCLVMGVKYQNY